MRRGKKLASRQLGFDDVEPGDWFETSLVRLTESHIDRFAELSGDFFDIHMSDRAAREHGFPARVAHGILVLALTDGLKNRADATFRAIASLSWDWSFDRPVFVGDTIQATVKIAEKRETRKRDRAILKLEFDVRNQNDETVQSGSNLLLVYR